MNRFKITGICFVVALLVLSGCASQKSIVLRDIQFSSPQAGVVKVMTFNIRVGIAFWDGPNRWNKRKQIVVDTLIDNAADVIGLQEALDFQVEHIRQALPQYSRYAVGRNNGKQQGEACAIFYRKDRFTLLDQGNFWFSRNHLSE